MTELQIEYFLKVTEHMNISETAAEMFVSQAAISRQIAALEQELDLKLFERKYRRLSLTGAGEILADVFSRHKKELAEAISEAKKHQNLNHQTINIGFLEGFDLDSIFRSLLEFKKANPNHVYNISIESISTLMEGVASGRFDMAFTFHQELKDSQFLRAIPMSAARFQLFLSKDHPLADKEDLSIDDLKNETFAAPVTDSDLVRREYGNLLLNICGYIPHDIQCKPNLDSVMAEVRYNNRVAVLYDRTIVAYRESYRIIETNAYNHISLLYSKSNTNPLLPRILRHLEPMFMG